MICSVFTMGYNLIISGYNQIAVPVLLIMLAVRIVSAIIFDGFVTPALGKGLVKAGLLKSYAIADTMDDNLED